VTAGSRSQDGYAAVETALGGGVTAIVCFNDLVALGVLARLRELATDG
jgi:LacI family transcriptional regulator